MNFYISTRRKNQSRIFIDYSQIIICMMIFKVNIIKSKYF